MTAPRAHCHAGTDVSVSRRDHADSGIVSAESMIGSIGIVRCYRRGIIEEAVSSMPDLTAMRVGETVRKSDSCLDQ